MRAASGYANGFTALAVASAYYVTGTLGLIWAVPPGFATLIWAPAGIALAATYWSGWQAAVGVAFGSFMVNIWVPSQPDREIHFYAGIIPALGACAQALVGAWLLRRALVLPQKMHRALGLVGVAFGSALVNGTIGPVGLWAAGIIPTEYLAESWRTWWMGDALGMLIVVPLLFLLETSDTGKSA